MDTEAYFRFRREVLPYLRTMRNNTAGFPPGHAWALTDDQLAGLVDAHDYLSNQLDPRPARHAPAKTHRPVAPDSFPLTYAACFVCGNMVSVPERVSFLGWKCAKCADEWARSPTGPLPPPPQTRPVVPISAGSAVFRTIGGTSGNGFDCTCTYCTALRNNKLDALANADRYVTPQEPSMAMPHVLGCQCRYCVGSEVKHA